MFTSNNFTFIINPKIRFEIPKSTVFHYVGLDDVNEKLEELREYRGHRGHRIFKEIMLMSRTVTTNSEDEWTANNYAKIRFDLSVLRNAFPEHFFWQSVARVSCIYPDHITIIATIVAGNVPSQEDVIRYLNSHEKETDMDAWLMAIHINNPAILDNLVKNYTKEYSHVRGSSKGS